MSTPAGTIERTALAERMQQYWGYDTFRPLQFEAMDNIVSQRDSLVVLPTGGGKSLCFQVPAVCMDGMAVVVSPLISLMKDQVDALKDCGVPAACVNSTLSVAERREIANRVSSGELKLLYLAPERLNQPRTIEFLQTANVSFIAIDEAHCISQWGHDFRPDYRELASLRESFPGIGIHGFTATATEHVRHDIAASLGLAEPSILVGSFDRPNLTYRVEKRSKALNQIRDVMDRHKGESGIIYCISRAKVEQTSASLNELGYRTRPYHAGLEDKQRQKHQNEFIAEDIDTIVATVAFGMGIDKSNVRYVVHSGMPKSLENYQQEAGRAGRDGLEADCVLLYSMGDYNTWQRIVTDSDGGNLEAAMRSLGRMAGYCGSVMCRHKTLVEHFGEPWTKDNCGACDVCSGDLELVDDPVTLSQKILSSVVRQGQRFGGEYTTLVLKGSADQRIMANRHDELTTYGLLESESKKAIRDWVEQLVAQDFLQKVGEYNILQITESGAGLLKGEGSPRLLKPSRSRKERGENRRSTPDVSWEGVDRDLFESLRGLRKELATQRGVPPYIVFGDASLREMALHKPTTKSELRGIKGVGEKKLADYGDIFLERIANYSAE
jgi:ATP-dependent DNA helicase RecQ